MIRHLPNLVTMLRVILIPVFVVCYYLPVDYSHWLAVWLFVAAGVSDGVDGYIARKWKLSSNLGQLLDPIADKLIVATALIVITSHFAHWWYVVAACITIGREMIISSMREWASRNGISASVQVSLWGKIKTFIQFCALSFLIFGREFQGIDIRLLGDILLTAAVVLSLMSLLSYCHALHAAYKNR